MQILSAPWVLIAPAARKGRQPGRLRGLSATPASEMERADIILFFPFYFSLARTPETCETADYESLAS
jgi:hypothetical protein